VLSSHREYLLQDHHPSQFFENATGFTPNNPTFVDVGSVQYPRTRRTGELPSLAFDSWLEVDDYDEGLGKLYDESLPNAIYGSAARRSATVTPPILQDARIATWLKWLLRSWRNLHSSRSSSSNDLDQTIH
jgi:hypothetical protein